MDNKLRETWDAGRGAINGWLAIPSTVTAELVGRHDYDSVTIDLQHGLNDYHDALRMLQALAAGAATPVARVPWLEPGIIMKLLDAGALGIICPMVNTPEDAAKLVRYCRYAPLGERSFGPTRAIFQHGADYPSLANEAVVCLAMVETRQALDNVERIAATPGLTGIYIGPSDLSLSLGHTPKLDHDEPQVVDAIKRILAAAKEAGIKAGIHTLAPAYAKQMLALGFDLVTVGSDLRLLNAAIASSLAEMRG